MGGLMKKELILIFIAIMIAALAYCLAEEPDSAKKVAKTGDIMGTAVNCDNKPIVNAEVFLNGMPDSILQSYLQAEGTQESPYTAWPMRVYKDQNITSTRTDSIGNFIFRNILIGYYQVYCYAPNETPIRDPGAMIGGDCATVPVDYVRVAEDSVSLVGLPMSAAYGFDPSFQLIWLERIQPRGEAKDEHKHK
jgi:hypothetical protein